MKNIFGILMLMLVVSCGGKTIKETPKQEVPTAPVKAEKFVPAPIDSQYIELDTHLKANKWVPDYNRFGPSLEFLDDQNVRMQINYEGDFDWWTNNYTIIDNEIVLYITYDSNGSHNPPIEYRFKIKTEGGSFKYGECLASDAVGTVFWNENSLASLPEVFVADGIEVTSLRKAGYIDSTTYFYSAPSLDSQKYFWEYFYDENGPYFNITELGDTKLAVEVIGTSESHPGWYLILWPRTEMRLEGTATKHNVCWVSADQISF